MKRRLKVVLALALALGMMVTISVAPALANNNNNNKHNNDNRDNSNNNHDWLDNNRHKDFFDHRDNDANLIFVSDNHFDDLDCCDDDDHRFYPYGFNTFGFNHSGDYGCWEWSWVFERYEWEEDCD